MNKRGITFIIFLILFLVSWQFWQVRDFSYQLIFDLFKAKESLETQADLDVFMANFEKSSYTNLPSDFLKITGSDSPPFDEILRGAKYLLISANQLYQPIIGNIRLKHFVSRDAWYKRVILGEAEFIPCIINYELLYKLIDLRLILADEGYDSTAMKVVDGHRNPKHNEAVGGAARSRHILGEAIDLRIGDIDQDGSTTQQDKAIVLDLLETTIIANQGGIGRYPGTMSVHFDLRGHRARWDSY